VRLTNLLHGVSEQPTCQRSKQCVQHSGSSARRPSQLARHDHHGLHHRLDQPCRQQACRSPPGSVCCCRRSRPVALTLHRPHQPHQPDALPYRRGHETAGIVRARVFAARAGEHQTPGIVRAGCLLPAPAGTKQPASFVPASLVPVHRSAPVDVRPPPLSITRPQPSTDDNQNRSIRAGGS